MRNIESYKKRMRIRVYGIVQGVGFRPFVSRIAMKNNIYGSVCNKGSYVEIYAQAKEDDLKSFLRALSEEAPARSVILKIKTEDTDLVEEIDDGDGTDAGNGKFNIIESSKERGLVFVSPDIATCPDCERELFDKKDRRYLHPFINCTACGPRLTILDSMPYDRARTSMGEFAMCPECEYEYTHASTRRYHAQPVCCNNCGPNLYIIGREEKDKDAIIYARNLIRGGGIIAIKGIGGFHLCCDAKNDEAVKRLRDLKHRPMKPFAVMMHNMDVVREECTVIEGQESILEGPQKPIILLEKKNHDKDHRGISEYVAPENPNIGVMLPYAPVQMLLFDYPDGEKLSDAFVMTSGNPSGAPICMNDEEAIKYLSPMCDAILSNPRKIRIRADDSVMSYYRGKPYMIRRSRGYAPLPSIMSKEINRSVLGIGGELKNTFCIATKDMYYSSPYIGDMMDMRSVRALEAAEERLETLLEIKPEAVACDLHPKYNSSAVGRKIADDSNVPIIDVQHHHAHIASCMAENNIEEKVIGISFDGTGYGPDGSIWGGEFLLADYNGYDRVGSIEPFVHAGGDLASKEGWRIALSLLLDSYKSIDEVKVLAHRLKLGGNKENQELNAQFFMLGNGVNTVKSTSAGRIFDAVSAILGIRQSSTFEGEASMALEFAGESYQKSGDFKEEYDDLDIDVNSLVLMKKADEKTDEGNNADDRLNNSIICNTTALVKLITERYLNGEDRNRLAFLFHNILAEMITKSAVMIREEYGINVVALSGGVYQNLLLLDLSEKKLQERGFKVIKHSLVPTNDGGIALGQAAIAMNYLDK